MNPIFDATSRRDFIKTFGKWIGSSAVLSTIPWLSAFASEAGASGQKARMAIIGVGSRGSGLLLNMLAADNIEVVAVCDNYEPHYKKAIEMTGGKAKAFYDYRKVLEMKEVDAVVVATPLYEHADIVVDAFSAGKHVLCEKSMARTIADCTRMYKAHKAAGKVMVIGFQRMFHPRYLHAYEQIKNGAIGQVTQVKAFWHRNNDWRRPVPSPDLERKINWRMYDEYSCGLMTELASHHIQVANWFLGMNPIKVSGSGSINYWKDGREVYDSVNLVYTYPGGIHLNYDSLISNKWSGLEIEFRGDTGMYQMEKNKHYPEKAATPAGIRQLINDIEHAVFDKIPIGGATWIPETAENWKGQPVLNDDTVDETFLQIYGFANAVIEDKKEIPGYAEQGYHAGIATLMGHNAMKNDEIVYWPEEVL
jgi:predicted dehydrogenase